MGKEEEEEVVTAIVIVIVTGIVALTIVTREGGAEREGTGGTGEGEWTRIGIEIAIGEDAPGAGKGSSHVWVHLYYGWPQGKG